MDGSMCHGDEVAGGSGHTLAAAVLCPDKRGRLASCAYLDTQVALIPPRLRRSQPSQRG